jgi:2-iminobutanoate/2-iminopropanoate deaminase
MMSPKSVVRTESAPGPFQGAPYSQAVRAGGLVFVSGQVPAQVGSGQIREGGITEQTEQVMENLKAILEAAGSGVDRLVKTTVFLTDLANFAAMNEVYARYVGSEPPARATVQIAGLPMGALLEIEAIAEV